LPYDTFIQDSLVDATSAVNEDIFVTDLGEETPYGFEYNLNTGWTFTYILYVTDNLQPVAGYNISDIESYAVLLNPDGTEKSVVPPANTSYAKVPQYDTSVGQQSLAIAGNNLYVIQFTYLDFTAADTVAISVRTTVTLQYIASPTCPTYEMVFLLDVAQDASQCPIVPDPNLTPFNWIIFIPPPDWDTIINDPTKIDGQTITGVSPTVVSLPTPEATTKHVPWPVRT
jgi:hypothetical protein